MHHKLTNTIFPQKLFAEIEALKQESLSYSPDNAHVTVFRELLASKLPPSEKEPKRLAADAQVLVSAGSETTARALTFATFCLLTNSGVLRCLKQELEKAVPTSDPASSISLSQLQNLPYLSGVIKESLRLSYGVAGRLARVRPNEDMKYQSWVIPAGTPVSMTSYDVHHDESVFPDSHFFKPERWIQNPGLERYLVSFGKGTRQCLGMSLAYAEMYLTLGRLFRWLGSGEVRGEEDVGVLELWATDKSDFQMVGEVLVPFVKQGSKGVRAILRS
jgi:cytochrome P450